MKKLFFLISIFALLIGISSCQDTCDNVPAPGKLSTKNISSTSAELSWDAVKGVSSYDIEISATTLANKTVVSTGSSTTTSFSVTGLSAGKSYSAKVTPRCTKDYASSNSSEVAFSTTPSCDLPAVTNLTTKPSPTLVVVNFGTITGVQSYKIDIYTATVPKVLVTTKTVQQAQLPITIPGLTPGTAYEVEVAAICTNNNTPSTTTARGYFVTPIIIDDDILMFGSKSTGGDAKFDNACSVLSATTSTTSNTFSIMNNGIHNIKITDNTGTTIKCNFRLSNRLFASMNVMKFCYKDNGCTDTPNTLEPKNEAATGTLYFDLDGSSSTQMKVSFSRTDFIITIPSTYKLYVNSQMWP